MRIFGLDITRVSKAMTSVPVRAWNRILESFPGAWQQNVEVKQRDLLTYPTLYACLKRISEDVGKLPKCLKSPDANGIWNEVNVPAYSPVLRKPNSFQTAQQFSESWELSKLIQGNTYVLMRRDNRGVVIAMYVLDPCRVQPMVTESGAVYYQLKTDPLNSLPEGYPSDRLLVPASEIIHDRCMTLHHPLVGVPPVCAAYWPTVKNLKILESSATFFSNSAQPGGILSAPAGMADEDAQQVKDYWNQNFTGANAGRVAVIGADMKFTSFAMKSNDAQLIEQMKYSDEQICQAFGIPPFKIGIGSIPAGLGVDAINLMYYDDALSTHIEAMENLLDEALALDPAKYGIWLDTEPLLRMDIGKQAEVEATLVGGKIKTPDEARKRFNLGPTGGGSTLWGQQQDYPLGTLENRADWDPNMQPPAAPVAPATEEETAEEVRQLRAELWARKALEATREAINA